MTQIEQEIDKYREIIKQYDDGLLSVASCESMLRHIALDRLLEAIEKGNEWLSLGSCCCLWHPPERTFRAEFVIQPHGFTAKRIL
jgi:hypothetical protein